MVKKKRKSILKTVGIAALFVSLGLYVLFQSNKPSNNRNWEYGFEKLAAVSQDGSTIMVKNFRDIQISGNNVTFTYEKRAINMKDAIKTWLVFEPFPVSFLPGFKGVAHTYFIFDFKNAPPVAFSVEARREKGEAYSAEMGMFIKFELMYLWVTEKDATIQRAAIRKNDVFMFPLLISEKETQGLLLQLAKDTTYLESHPKFYNSLFSNCTNELAKSVNRSRPGTVPFNMALFFPGFSDSELYKLGFIPHDKPLSEIKKEYYITPLVQKIYNDADFSTRLRKELASKK